MQRVERRQEPPDLLATLRQLSLVEYYQLARADDLEMVRHTGVWSPPALEALMAVVQ